MIFVLEKAYFIANMSGLAWSCQPVLTLKSTLSMKLVQREESFQIMPLVHTRRLMKKAKKTYIAPISILLFSYLLYSPALPSIYF